MVGIGFVVSLAVECHTRQMGIAVGMIYRSGPMATYQGMPIYPEKIKVK